MSSEEDAPRKVRRTRTRKSRAMQRRIRAAREAEKNFTGLTDSDYTDEDEVSYKCLVEVPLARASNMKTCRKKTKL